MQDKHMHRRNAVKGFLDIVITFFIVTAIYTGIRYFIRFPSVNGTSMQPTYHTGDTLVVFYTKDVHVNDIAVSWSEPLGEYIVKRVIGVPGDSIVIRDGALYRNGARIYESYINDQDWYSDNEVSLTLKDNEFFMLGDNRNDSIDSRKFGTVPRSDIFGRVICRDIFAK